MEQKAPLHPASSLPETGLPVAAVGVFLLSWISLTLEVVLTRVLSTILWHSVVYLVVSMAVLGLGLGALWASQPGRLTSGNRTSWAMGLGLAIAASTALIYLYPAPQWWPGYLIMAALPFVVVGALLSALFRGHSAAGYLYFADLTGAGLGSLLVIPVLDRFGGVGALAVITGGAFVLAFFFALQSRACGRALVAVGLVTAAAFSALLGPRSPIPAVTSGITPEKTLYRVVSEERGQVLHSHWDSFSRTDTVARPGGEAMSIFTDGGAGSKMFRFDGDLQKVAFLTSEPGFLPYLWGPHAQVLVIGPGGGKDVLTGLLGGAQSITAVELSPGVVDAVNRFDEFNGHLFHRDDVRLVQGNGRAYLERSAQKYDLIFLPLTVTQTVDGSGSLSENYLFTKESVENYLSRLGPGGKLVVQIHDEAEALKFFLLAASVLQARGESLAEAVRHIVVVNGAFAHGAAGGIMLPVVVVQREPLTPGQIAAVRGSAERLRQQLLFLPAERGGWLPEPLATGEFTMDRVVRLVPALRLSPATDDQPFFWEFKVGLPDQVIGLLSATGLACLGVVLAVRRRKAVNGRRTGETQQGGWERVDWPYFAGLGMAYMMVEIGLIQRGRLLLGDSGRAIAAVLFGLLVGGGLGSLLLEVLEARRRLRWWWILPAVGVAAAGYGLGLLRLFSSLDLAGENARFLALAGSVLPLGLLMGIPFPLGLGALWRGANPVEEVPRMMAVNGVFGVFGSVFALATALTAGYTWTFLAGGAIYLLLGLTFRTRLRSE